MARMPVHSPDQHHAEEGGGVRATGYDTGGHPDGGRDIAVKQDVPWPLVCVDRCTCLGQGALNGGDVFGKKRVVNVLVALGDVP